LQKKLKGTGIPRQRKDKAWVWKGTWDLPDGSTRVVQIVRKNYDDCIAEIEKIKSTKSVPATTTSTLGEWWDKWLNQYYKINTETSTFENAQSISKCHIVPKLGKIKLKKLTTSDIQLFAKNMLRKYSAAHVWKAVSLIKVCLKQAQKELMIPLNPADNVKIPKPKSMVGKAYDKDELIKLLTVAQHHPLFPALVLMLKTGLRRGELLALTWDKIDFNKKTITVSANYVKTLKGGELKLPKTQASISKVPLDDYSIKALEGIERKSNVVFPGRDGWYMRPLNFQRVFARWRSQAGVEGRIQDLRHTFATMILDNNTPLKTAQTLTRHGQLSTLTNIYAHTTHTAQIAATDVLAGQIENLIPVRT
jgi:integrase